MAKYRKLPVEIEAFQLNSRGLVGEDWFWDAVTRNDIITHSFGKHEPEDAWCEIKTLEGTMIAQTGDYIIRGIKGEIYPCRADIFHATYTRNSADAVSVVRCKDCKHSVKYNCKNDACYSFTICRRRDGYAEDVEEDDFCSYGERKEQNNV
jgi:hypothetical protein